jgi:hypothetical protein
MSLATLDLSGRSLQWTGSDLTSSLLILPLTRDIHFCEDERTQHLLFEWSSTRVRMTTARSIRHDGKRDTNDIVVRIAFVRRRISLVLFMFVYADV